MKIKENFLVSPYLVFFLVHSIQVGVGVLGYQRVVAKFAGYDSWISVLFAGMIIHILIYMIYYVLNTGGGDITSIHTKLFGKYIGTVFNLVLILYFAVWTITVLRTYIEVVQVWMFPTLETWKIASVFLLLTYYVVSAGFRTVTGVCFLGVVLPFGLIVLLVFPLQYSHFTNLLPVFDESIKDYIISTKSMMLSYLGFESLLVFYPFVKNAKTSEKYAHFGNFLTVLIYLTITIITFSFFSEEQLARNVWATLSMVKVVQVSFVERFDYFFVSFWCLVILTNIALSIWASSRLAKVVFKVRHHQMLILISGVVLVVCVLLKTRFLINLLNNYTNILGFYMAAIYIPLLFIASVIKNKKKKHDQMENSSAQ
ncbi:GerAB/ArcD/ProY family transporter [Fictibacillus aquaticus]|nr:GerAB/ArcD/ProY family transporter [Fictibacillus aquaticus]